MERGVDDGIDDRPTEVSDPPPETCRVRVHGPFPVGPRPLGRSETKV